MDKNVLLNAEIIYTFIPDDGGPCVTGGHLVTGVTLAEFCDMEDALSTIAKQMTQHARARSSGHTPWSSGNAGSGTLVARNTVTRQDGRDFMRGTNEWSGISSAEFAFIRGLFDSMVSGLPHDIRSKGKHR